MAFSKLLGLLRFFSKDLKSLHPIENFTKNFPPQLSGSVDKRPGVFATQEDVATHQPGGSHSTYQLPGGS